MDARQGLGWTNYALDDWDAAIGAFEAAIAIDPHSAEAYLGKAHALSAKDDAEGACQALADGMSNQPDGADEDLEGAREELECP